MKRLPREPRPPTLAELYKRMEGDAIHLRIQLEKFEARKPAYQEGFIPTYVSNAQNAYDASKRAYDAAVADQANTDAAREDGHR